MITWWAPHTVVPTITTTWFTLSEGATMPTTTVPQGNIVDLTGRNTLTLDEIERLHDAYFIWQSADHTTQGAQENWDLVATERGITTYSGHVRRFIDWLREHPEHNIVPVAAPTAAPIGPDTPGWVSFWEQLAEHAVDEGYEEQYNTLANAFGAATIDDEDSTDQEYWVEVQVSMTVRLDTMATPRDVDSNGIGEYVDEEMVDDAIRSFIRNNSADWSIGDYGRTS